MSYRNSRNKDRIKQLKKDPLKALEDMGLTYDNIVDSLVGPGKMIQPRKGYQAFYSKSFKTFRPLIQAVDIDGEEIFIWES